MNACVEAESAPPIEPRRAAAWVALIAVIAFLPILRIPYAIDSIPLITQAPGMQSWSALRGIFDPAQYNGLTRQFSFRPLLSLTYLVDINLFGAKPMFSHAMQILLHAGNAAMLTLLAMRLGASARAAKIAGGLFAAHPVVTEAVNCAGFRGDLMATAGVLGAALFAHRWGSEGRIRDAIAAVAIFFLGLASKESAITGLVVVPLVAGLASPVQHRTRRSAALAAGMLASAIAFLIVWKQFHAPAAPYDRLGGSLALGLANFARIFAGIYVPAWFAPIHLKTFHEFDISTAIDAKVAASLVVITILGVVALRASRSNSLCLLGAIGMAAGLAPISQLIAVPDPVAERFLYLPHVGFALLIGGLIAPRLDALAPDRRKGLLALVLLVAIGLTWKRHYDWRDERSLNLANFERDRTPTEFGLQTMGVLYLARNAPGDIVRSADAAKALRARFPENSESWRISALAEYKSGNAVAAVEHATRAVEIAPSSLLAWRVLAAASASAFGAEDPRTVAANARVEALASDASTGTFAGQAGQFK